MSSEEDEELGPVCHCGEVMQILDSSERTWSCSECKERKARCAVRYTCDACNVEACDECAWTLGEEDANSTPEPEEGEEGDDGAAQEQLQPEIAPPTSSEIYAYRVLKDFDGVALGQGVELQWKMQMGSPFGWWYGRVERIERGGSGAAVTLIFPHFPTNSRWYRLRVVVGDGIIRRCGIGGYHGGIRAVTPEEEKVWMQFRPKEPITF
eukprot:g26389.t1